jgi:ATP-dependent Clp protease, protease subunit
MDWLKINCKDENAGEIYLYGVITDEKWFDEDVTPTWFKDQVAKLKNLKKINLYINSPGGGVFAGMTIYNIINRLSADVTAYIDGLAASIASVIAMAADKIIMPKNALMMIHNPMSVAVGTAADMRKEAEILDRAKISILSTYAGKTKNDEKSLSDMMDAETWMTGEEAVKNRFADVLEEKKNIKACYEGNKIVINGLSIDPNDYKSFPVDRFQKPLAVVKRERYTNGMNKLFTLKKELL